MLTNKKKITLALVAITLVGFGSVTFSFLFSPYLAIYQFGQAASARNSQELQQLIDFPRLRVNLKPRIKTLLCEELDRHNWGYGVDGSTKSLITCFLIDPIADVLISPTGLDTLLDDKLRRKCIAEFSPPKFDSPAAPEDGFSQDAYAAQSEQPGTFQQARSNRRQEDVSSVDSEIASTVKAFKPSASQMLTESSYKDFDTFTVPLAVSSRGQTETVNMTFSRDGIFNWRLTDIDLDHLYGLIRDKREVAGKDTKAL